MNRRLLLGVALILSFLVPGVGAQGVQTGTLTGTLRSADGLTLPEASVTVAPPRAPLIVKLL